MCCARSSGAPWGDRLAATRLRLLHRAFGPTSRSLLEELRSRGPFETALDLGCGPGCTTGLLAEVLRPRRLLGIDVSETFLRFGRRQVPDAEFVAHDLRIAPYPGAPAAMLYARYVLGHLGDLGRWFRTWTDQLAPGGRLVIPLGCKDVQQLSVVERTPHGTIDVRNVIPVRFTLLETMA